MNSDIVVAFDSIVVFVVSLIALLTHCPIARDVA
jgi:hypothetical protein